MKTTLFATASDLGMMRRAIAQKFNVVPRQIGIIKGALCWDVFKDSIWMSDYHIVFQNNRFEFLKVTEDTE